MLTQSAILAAASRALRAPWFGGEPCAAVTAGVHQSVTFSVLVAGGQIGLAQIVASAVAAGLGQRARVSLCQQQPGPRPGCLVSAPAQCRHVGVKAAQMVLLSAKHQFVVGARGHAELDLFGDKQVFGAKHAPVDHLESALPMR